MDVYAVDLQLSLAKVYKKTEIQAKRIQICFGA